MTTSGTVARDGDRAGDRLLDLAPELGRVDDLVVAGAQAREQRDVAGGVERVGRAHAIAPPEPHELRLGEVEAVHRHEHGAVAQRAPRPVAASVDLPPPGGPAMPRMRAPAAGDQPARAGEQRVEVVDHHALRVAHRASLPRQCAPS